MQRYSHRLAGNARRLRRRSTDAESLLWRHLRRKQLLGLRFYRQRPVLDYIVDFYSPKARLVIELDGGQHYSPEGWRRDRVRDGNLEELGLKVLRFNDRAVLTELNSVLEAIRLAVEERNPL